MSHLISPADLEATITRLFEHAGTATDRARQVAANLVLANLSGHDSHGVGMAPRYVDAILEGRLETRADVAVRVDNGMLLGLDGQSGFGQVVGVQAMEMAFERVAAHGACIFSLASAHHLGRIGHFAEMAVARGWIALHFVSVSSRPNVAPFGGSDGRFGTNPCCIGIPLGLDDQVREPFVLDFATSRVAQGKMRVAHNEGKEVAPGTLIDLDGPFGAFGLPPALAERPLLFVAGGTGIAPLRSILMERLSQPRVPDIAVVYSARTADQFAYRTELDAMARAGRIRLFLTVSRLGEGWQGRLGRIDEELLKAAIPSPDACCLVCGPPPLVSDTTVLLQRMGVGGERILTEKY